MDCIHNKNRKKNLVKSLFSLHSNRFIRLGSVDLLTLPSRNRNHPGQHGHGGAINKFEKNATNQQSTRKTLYGLVSIMVLLRLAPRDCWLIVVLGQDEGCHGQWNAQRFCFCCVQSFKRARGSEFQKMHVEFYVNILARACSTQESNEYVNFLDNFLAHSQDQYLWS
jgi:hypothetical protein